MKNCEFYQEQILLSFDNELADIDKKEVDEHLKTCMNCTLFKKMMQVIDDKELNLQPSYSPSFNVVLTEKLKNGSPKYPLYIFQKAASFILIIIGIYFITNYSITKYNDFSNQKPQIPVKSYNTNVNTLHTFDVDNTFEGDIMNENLDDLANQTESIFEINSTTLNNDKADDDFTLNQHIDAVENAILSLNIPDSNDEYFQDLFLNLETDILYLDNEFSFNEF